jgi:hypothetical protein
MNRPWQTFANSANPQPHWVFQPRHEDVPVLLYANDDVPAVEQFEVEEPEPKKSKMKKCRASLKNAVRRLKLKVRGKLSRKPRDYIDY